MLTILYSGTELEIQLIRLTIENNCKAESVGIHAVYTFQNSKFWETLKENMIQSICNKNMTELSFAMTKDIRPI